MAAKQPQALAGLTPEARRLHRQLTREYDIRDAGGLAVLQSGLRALDLAVQFERQVATEGATLTDRFGQLRSHPLLPLARDYRAQWHACLRQLNLAVGDPPKAGRPEGS